MERHLRTAGRGLSLPGEVSSRQRYCRDSSFPWVRIHVSAPLSNHRHTQRGLHSARTGVAPGLFSLSLSPVPTCPHTHRAATHTSSLLRVGFILTTSSVTKGENSTSSAPAPDNCQFDDDDVTKSPAETEPHPSPTCPLDSVVVW